MLAKTRFRDLLCLVTLSVISLILPFSALAQDHELTHVVQQGENLYRISLRYGVDMDALAQANGLANLQSIYAGQELLIPGMQSVDTGDNVENPLVAASPILHTVQRGETLVNIAAQYGVTVQQVLDANSIPNANRINPGDELQIWSAEVSDTQEPAATDAPASTSTFTHTVQRGEYLYQIARAYNVSWTTVAELNGITDPNRITPGTDLLIPESQDTLTDASETTETIETVESTTHVVRSGEHLSQIAQQYGVAWTTIAEANNIADPNTLYAGMELVIPGASESLSLGIIENPAAAYAPGPYVGTGRELVVKLSTQTAYAYEDGQLIKSSVVSTGLPATPTVQGNFKIYLKYESQTMSGPGYYLPGVPWVMYFYSGYGFHGTYWHSNFGNPMSHGCVNMNNDDAKWFWEFAPIGTPVHVTL